MSLHSINKAKWHDGYRGNYEFKIMNSGKEKASKIRRKKETNKKRRKKEHRNNWLKKKKKTDELINQGKQKVVLQDRDRDIEERMKKI